ncbi:MAG: glycosyltransferase family 4 protein [Planctomycetota bacterium]
MKILFVSTYTDRVGGAEGYQLDLAAALAERGHAVVRFGTEPDREVERPDLRVVRRERFRREGILRDAGVTEALRTTLAAVDPDVVHAHNLWGLPIEVDLLLARAPVGLVQTIHDFSTFCPNSWCVRGDGSPCPGGAGQQCFEHDCGSNYPFRAEMVAMTELRQRVLSRAVDVALAPSAAVQAMARAHGFADVRLAPYFLREVGAVDPEPLAGQRFVFAGRLQREKGVDVLLRAFALARVEAPAARLDVLGDGDERRSLEALARGLELGDAVRFLGDVPNTEVAHYLRGAAAVVVPSIWTEAFGLTSLEAFRAGVPVVASRIGGIPEIVEDGVSGVLVEPRDAEDLARALVRVLGLDDAERARYVAAGRRRGAEFTRDGNVATVLAAYSDASAVPDASKSVALTDAGLAAWNGVLAELRDDAPTVQRWLRRRLKSAGRRWKLPKLLDD